MLVNDGVTMSTSAYSRTGDRNVTYDFLCIALQCQAIDLDIESITIHPFSR